MENAGWFWLLFLTLQFLASYSQDMSGWWNIDCGSEESRVDQIIIWDIDADYTKTGTNIRIQQNQSLEEMNTLRFFPDKNQQNCYIVPAYVQTLRYLIRVGFYYGNYDNLSKPPTFDLVIDDEKWSTVNTSLGGKGPIYHEAIYVTHGLGFLKVCLVQTRDGEVPFISSIEVVPLWDNLYPQMESNATFHLVSRVNLGGDEIRSSVVLSGEMYNRIWTRGTTPPNCINIETIPDLDSPLENNPPIISLMDSIQSNDSSPIILTVDLPQLISQPAYFVFYFAEIAHLSDDTRTMVIKINDKDEKIVVAPNFMKNKVVTMYPVTVSGPTINITLRSTNGSTLPPLIAAMEVFTRSDSNHVHSVNTSARAANHFFASMWIVVVYLVMMVVKMT